MIPTQVIKRIGMEKAKGIRMLTEVVRSMEDVSWGDMAMRMEQQRDAQFVKMSNPEFVAYLNTEEGKKMKGLEMIRINHKRMFRERSESDESVEEAPKTPKYWYTEYTRYPHLYFANEAEQKAAIAEVMQEWRTGVGRWRMGLMDQAAKKIQEMWKTKHVCEESLGENSCSVCRVEDITQDGKCDKCADGICRTCKEVYATPGTVQCLKCYYTYTYPQTIDDMDEVEWCKLCHRNESKCPGNFCMGCYDRL